MRAAKSPSAPVPAADDGGHTNRTAAESVTLKQTRATRRGNSARTLGDIGFIIKIHFDSGGSTPAAKLADGNQLIRVRHSFRFLLLLARSGACLTTRVHKLVERTAAQGTVLRADNAVRQRIRQDADAHRDVLEAVLIDASGGLGRLAQFHNGAHDEQATHQDRFGITRFFTVKFLRAQGKLGQGGRNDGTKEEVPLL
jgi:hypothetical protein